MTSSRSLEVMIDQIRAIYHRSLNLHDYVESTILFIVKVHNEIYKINHSYILVFDSRGDL